MKKIKNIVMLGCSLGLVFTMGSCSKEALIKVYTRDTTSGTREGFFEGIGFNDAKKDNSLLAKGYVEVSGNDTMISGVKQDENGIGYISLSSLKESSLKGLTYEGVVPSEENVLNGTYQLTRNFNYCIRESYSDVAKKEIVEAFISYMGTIEGKSTIQEHGGIVENSSSDKSWEEIKGDYDIASKDNSKVTIVVGGSTSVKSIISNLLNEFSAKCGNFVYEHNPTGSGDAYKRTNGSEKDGVNACDLAFASREFKNDSEPMDESLKGKMCVDAIVAVVNKSNSINSITKDQLKKIYDGTYTKWSEVK